MACHISLKNGGRVQLIQINILKVRIYSWISNIRWIISIKCFNNPLIWISHLIYLGSCDSVPNLSSQTPTKARLQLRRASVSLDEGRFPQNNVQTLLSRHRSLQVKYFSLFLDRVKHRPYLQVSSNIQKDAV